MTIPLTAVGWQIALIAEDSGGSSIIIGTSNLDGTGNFEFKWTPPNEDFYINSALYMALPLTGTHTAKPHYRWVQQLQLPCRPHTKPTAAYILSLLGGILGLLASLAFIGFGAWSYAQYSDYLGYFGYDLGFFGWGWSTMIGFGAWMLITSILVIVFAGKLKSNPMEHTKWGVLILVCP